MNFLHALILISVAFALLERLRPARPQALLRRCLGRDLAYIVLNGHIVGSLTAIGFRHLAQLGLPPGWVPRGLAAGWSLGVQLAVHLVLFDFLQWMVHNLLHRVDALWRFHKVHHQIQEMDWLGNLHFHPVEILVYQGLLWIPSVMLGFDGRVLFATAVIGTAWGDFNHANLRASLGPFAYLVNGPQMHLWHHAHLEDTGGRPVNFAIIFTAWDWLFGTAWFPDHPPPRLGFAGVEHYPESLAGQLAKPFGAQ